MGSKLDQENLDQQEQEKHQEKEKEKEESHLRHVQDAWLDLFIVRLQVDNFGQDRKIFPTENAPTFRDVAQKLYPDLKEFFLYCLNCQGLQPSIGKLTQEEAIPVRMTAQEFKDLGLLQELNRLFLHPLGLALEVIYNEESGQVLGFGDVWDYRGDDEGMIFDPGYYFLSAGDSDDQIKQERYERFVANVEKFKAFALRRFALRRSRLQQIVQPVPGVPFSQDVASLLEQALTGNEALKMSAECGALQEVPEQREDG